MKGFNGCSNQLALFSIILRTQESRLKCLKRCFIGRRLWMTGIFATIGLLLARHIIG
jgi:hypothetical protein